MNQEFPTAKALVEATIGRPLKTGEIVRFKNKDKRGLALENIRLQSPTATAHEKFLLTGFVPGFSHCLCGCGESLGNPLSNEFKTANPRAYLEGHNPTNKKINKLRRKISDIANTPIAKPVGWPKGKPRGKRKPKLFTDQKMKLLLSMEPQHPLESYRTFFTKYFGNLPTEKFVKVIDFMNSPDF